jgi:hypothetical protein
MGKILAGVALGVVAVAATIVVAANSVAKRNSDEYVSEDTRRRLALGSE